MASKKVEYEVIGTIGRLRFFWDIICLFHIASLSILLSILRIRTVIALSVSKHEKLIIHAEIPERKLLLSARIHKLNKRPIKLQKHIAKVLDWLFANASNNGVVIYIKGCADKEWGLILPQTPAIKRIEIGIFGPNAHKPQNGFFSYVSDNHGIYYDGRQSTELETLLDSLPSGFWINDPAIRKFLTDRQLKGLQKYPEFDKYFDITPDPTAVLIAGQVIGDASTVYTFTLARSNFDLVKLAKEKFPNTPLYYKQHPHESSEAETMQIADEFNVFLIPSDVSFEHLCCRFRRILVNTSGAGLEAAMLGCTVYTAGVSFFSHWGFTHDFYGEIDRRSNQLTAQDVYGAFVGLYSKNIRIDKNTKQPHIIPFSEFEKHC
ncbi:MULTISPECIES: hypothetical protein [unclassified Pseudovibrio]|uniref:capsular polysaccharide export protein, LipB/KpsS family n=1 Tax=unclassified Pseudovibrio TaxID=2627060 RepID=UPI0007AE4A47|nr:MULTISPECIES: hypothetical protein [unclassified Pseudovibrio]KZK94454.1 Capsule polysaccharide biosynthesis protein [Pseudovibrio sp. W74]KZL07186.1 Capsule polysaccharide biosynthesis protein [Pseudovibrio sp. Ad14]